MNPSTLTGIQLRYKEKIGKTLIWLKNTIKWKKCIFEMGLNDYDFIIPDKTYYQQLLDLVGNSYLDTNALAEILHIDKHYTKTQISQKLKFILENGRGLITIHRKTKIIGGLTTFLDSCDLKDISMYYQNFVDEGNVKYVGELMGKLTKNNDGMVEEYGKYLRGGLSFINTKHQKTGIFAALTLTANIIVSELDYQGSYGESTNARLTNIIKLQGGVVVKSVDWKHVIFEDGKK